MRAWERRYERWEVREGEEAIKYMHVCVCMCECVRVCKCELTLMLRAAEKVTIESRSSCGVSV